jgi:hypothetical protein
MTFNRLLLLCLVSIGLSWTALYILDVSDRVHDRAFYDQKVAPQLKSGAAIAKGVPLDQWVERLKRRSDNAMTRLDLFIGGIALFMAWTVVNVIRGEIFWKKRNAPERVVDPKAGSAIAALREIGGVFIARTNTGHKLFKSAPREVLVNAITKKIVFRGFTFITGFIGNRRAELVSMHFQDILGGRIWVNDGQYSLSLRTTAGKVTVTDAVKPFHELAGLLFDVAEVNRSLPDGYAAALAREPRIRTPWYGWLIFALALAGVAGLAVFLWNLPTKWMLSASCAARTAKHG